MITTLTESMTASSVATDKLESNADAGAMTDSDRSRLISYENLIAANLRAFITVGVILREIRDKKYYRETHPNFEKYCRDRFDIGRAHSYRLIADAGVVNDFKKLSQGGDNFAPTNQSQTQALLKVPRDKWLEVMHRAAENAGDIKVNSKFIEKAWREISGVNKSTKALNKASKAKAKLEVNLADFRSWIKNLKHCVMTNQTVEVMKILNTAERDNRIPKMIKS